MRWQQRTIVMMSVEKKEVLREFWWALRMTWAANIVQKGTWATISDFMFFSFLNYRSMLCSARFQHRVLCLFTALCLHISSYPSHSLRKRFEMGWTSENVLKQFYSTLSTRDWMCPWAEAILADRASCCFTFFRKHECDMEFLRRIARAGCAKS